MSQNEWFPKIDFEGRIDLDSLRNMDVNRLASWITAVLRQEDSRLAGKRDDRTYLYLGRLYRRLNADTRECFRDALQHLLGKLAMKVSPDPEAPPADDLLLLVAKVYSGVVPNLRSAAVTHLRKIADEKPGRRLEGIHHRAVQTLVALRHGAPPRFWYRQFERGGDEYARVTFAGLSLIGPEEAFRWLARNTNRPAALEALFSRLPLLLREEPGDRDRIRDLLYGLCQHLKQEQLVRLQKFAGAIGFSLDPSPFVQWTADELTGLARGLNLTDVPLKGDRREQLTLLESKLSAMVPSGLEGYGVPKSALTLLGACRRLAGHSGVNLSQDLASKILNAVDDLVEGDTLDHGFTNELILASMMVRDKDLLARLHSPILGWK